MKWALMIGLGAFVLAAQAVPQKPAPPPAPRKIPCKTPANAATCFWTHGWLSLGNGTPAFRIWKVGTRRMLGVYSGPGSERRDGLDNEHPEFPANLANVYRSVFEEQVFADFEVCPLDRERERTMQPVRIESAKNIVIQKY